MKPTSLRSAAALAVLLAGAGCGKPEPAAAPIRLADLLDRATISSPLTEVPAVHSLAEIADARREAVFAEDFEDFDWDALRWPRTENAELAPTGDGHAFLLRASDRAELFGWYLPAQPRAHYVFERRARTDGPLEADFVVVERVLVDGRAAGTDDQALRVHRAQAPEPNGTWQRGSVAFCTHPSTKDFLLVLRATQRHPDDVRTGHETWFDELRLTRIEPTPRQMVGLVKSRSLAEGADPALGIRKHGQFPPLHDLNEATGPITDTFSYRYALYAPPPTELVFPLRVPAQAVLRFSVSLASETPPQDAAGFAIAARTDEGEQPLWEGTVAATEDDWRWHDQALDLAAFAGREIEIVLRTTAVRGHPHPVWGHPIVDVPPPGDGPRTVVLIAVDTLRADRLSSYGYAKPTSPHLDALAADGVRFENVAANANWTCPSFASILTGAAPSRHGVVTFGPLTPVPASFETLAERFRAHGWATQSIAYKAPLYDGGYEQGFDVAVNGLKLNVRGEENLAEAMLWLEANAGRRNFLFLHFDDPHQPFTQPPPYDRAFGDDPRAHGVALPHLVYAEMPESAARRALVSALYDGEIGYVDAQIGAFLEALEERGLYEDAIIAFVSDHGEQLWEHGDFGHGGTMVHDEVARVPLIVKPGGAARARGKVVATQVRAFDVMPTLLELAGIPVDDPLDALSLVPLLAPDAADAPDRVAVTEAGRIVALRNRAWKYVLHYGNDTEAIEQLFDLRTDPGETADVAPEHPTVLEQLRLQLLDYYLCCRPGRYLIAIDDPKAAPHDLHVPGLTSATSFAGLQPRAVTADGVSFAGRPAGALLLCAAVELGPTPATTPTPHDHGPYAPGDLQHLLHTRANGLHLFDGPRGPDEAPPPQTLSAAQLEALRAVGYTGSEGNNTKR